MTFITTANPPARGEEAAPANDPWFPAVSPDEVREAALLDGTVTPVRLRHALIEAMDTVNGELAAFRAQQEAAGHASLAAIPAGQLAGRSVNVVRYHRAINACVQALVAEAHRDIDTTPHSDGKGDRIRERLGEKIDAHRQAMRWAISDLLRIRRTTVELI
ncbi:head completion/stabilization protein [Acidovorax sp. SUPP1855]|uniref:head completion/stabilization protein n=1 Tax=Acidovorax sp. SUPP1855 TaxID=431774 RepID=UPI0023DE65CE|nr:head completion/stabilization protein [Acidovorax sp. SUPP1855]GKS83205.1 head completion/stabilization protein [Acidovorax sp. SUPP1855]